MKKVLGTAIFIFFAISIWLIGPVIAVAFNALVRPDYELRDLGTEYRARLRPNRVYWYDYKVFHMDCGGESERVVVLHTVEFDEPPSDFLARAHPECSDFERQDSDLWLGLRGILIGRW